MAYDSKARDVHGDKAVLNFPSEEPVVLTPLEPTDAGALAGACADDLMTQLNPAGGALRTEHNPAAQNTDVRT